MHSLWSRAAQAQSSCRCRICLHSGRSIARRSTTAASRRKVTAADLFTACYTTILGTATVIDAHRKESRTKELDEKLEKARAALNNLSVQEPTGQQGGQSNQPEAGTTNFSRNCSHEPRKTGPGSSNAPGALLQELSALYGITPRPLPRQSWSQNQLEWAQVESAIATEQQDPSYTLREPRSDQQLQRTTNTVIELVNRLIWQIHSCESTQRQDSTGKNADATGTDDIWKELRDVLQSSHYPSYRHPSIEADEAARTRSILGESIRRIFNQGANPKDTVAKICYNVLTSSAPPSIFTYNTLIAGFNRIQRPDLAQTVIDSYINDTAWPATQQTIVCLLNHYRGTNQLDGIRHTIQRMRGVKDTGLFFRIVDKNVIYSQDWLEWADKNCASRKYAYVQRAPRSDDVFNSIVKGWLYCGEVGNACTALIACLRNGGFVAVQTLQELFTACLSTADSAAARRLVKGFAKNIRNFAIMVNKIIHEESTTTSRHVVMSVSHLLDVSFLPSKDIFASFIRTHGQRLQQLKSYIDKSCIEVEIRDTANLCTAMLKGISSGDSLNTRVEGAISILDSAQQSRQNTTTTFNNLGALARLVPIHGRYQDLEARIKITTALVNASILKIKTGWDFDPLSLLGSERPRGLHKQQQYDSLYHALQNVQIRPGPMTLGDVKLQFLRRLPDPMLGKRFEDAKYITIRSLMSFYIPNTLTCCKPENRVHTESILQLERQLADIEEMTRAMLFASLSGDRQRWLRVSYPNWYETPLEKLFEYLMRRTLHKASAATDTQQTDATESCDQENPAARSIEEATLMVRGADGPNGIVPRRPATSHADIEKGLHSEWSITNLRSPSPSVLRDGDAHLSVAALGSYLT
ncbi:hypothetical protein F4819DRAFT_466106 [Hypoxylon fuscum]|nr:hypothetical protein F4819DRAFT_466106 [Hypoxylon fuscum]